MRRIALAILTSAFIFAFAAPADADGWTNWKTFASHNGVVLEWRTYSHPEHDTKANWRVTNNTTEGLYFLFLGTRIYTCSNGSNAVPHMRSSFGGAELSPGSSVTLSDGSANYVTADHIDRTSCASIAEVAFDKGTSWALEFAVGSPLEPEKPWMEHSFAAKESGKSVATCDKPFAGICLEFEYERESVSIDIRNNCESQLGGKYLPDGSCPKEGTAVCSSIPAGEWGVASWYIYDIDRFLIEHTGLTKDDIRNMDIHEKEFDSRGICLYVDGGTYLGFQ